MITQQHIQELFQLTRDEYCLRVEDEGYEWMRKYLGSEASDIVKLSGMFWKWWVNEWNIRDAEFIRDYGLEFEVVLNDNYRSICWYNYLQTHNVLRVQIRPNKWVIAEVNKMLRSEVNKLKKLQAQE